nr:uncharacterized protein LOC109736248 isoform X2 [Aegilops tauschii subsp. strangulata]
MALRALDNALPAAVADQRPKKAAKLLSTAPTVAVARSPTGSGADRGVRPVRGPAARPRPQSPAAGLVAGLDSRDWVMVCEALNDARRLAIHHPALLAPILEKVVLGILKTVKNPRSAVLKTFVMACTDVIAAFGNLWLSSSCSSSLSKPMRAMATSMPPCRCTELTLSFYTCRQIRGWSPSLHWSMDQPCRRWSSAWITTWSSWGPGPSSSRARWTASATEARVRSWG